MLSTQHWIGICLVIVGLINFVPVLGVISASKLTQGYGIELDSNELILLMRHRALLFGIIGAYVLASVYFTQFRLSAMVMAGISMLGFIVLFQLQEQMNTELTKIFWADIIGLVVLAIAMPLTFFSTTKAT